MKTIFLVSEGWKKLVLKDMRQVKKDLDYIWLIGKTIRMKQPLFEINNIFYYKA